MALFKRLLGELPAELSVVQVTLPDEVVQDGLHGGGRVTAHQKLAAQLLTAVIPPRDEPLRARPWILIPFRPVTFHYLLFTFYFFQYFVKGEADEAWPGFLTASICSAAMSAVECTPAILSLKSSGLVVRRRASSSVMSPCLNRKKRD